MKIGVSLAKHTTRPLGSGLFVIVSVARAFGRKTREETSFFVFHVRELLAGAIVARARPLYLDRS